MTITTGLLSFSNIIRFSKFPKIINELNWNYIRITRAIVMYKRDQRICWFLWILVIILQWQSGQNLWQTCKKTGRGFLMECLIKVYFTNIDLFGFKRHNINVKHIWSFKKNGNSLGGFVTQTSLTYFRKNQVF